MLFRPNTTTTSDEIIDAWLAGAITLQEAKEYLYARGLRTEEINALMLKAKGISE